MNFPTPCLLDVGSWHPTTAQEAVAGIQCGAGRSPKALGNGSVSDSWIPTIKERTKKPGQMAALVKAEDTGDRDEHEGLQGTSGSS